MSSSIDVLAEKKSINNIDTVFLEDVVSGLAQVQKTLPCKYFYDEQGSQLFEAICETPEYYVTRTECNIYQQYAGEMARLIGNKALLLEPGAGSVKKISYLLSALVNPVGFIPMDISPEILAESSQLLAKKFPELDITPSVVDFSDEQSLSAIFNRLPTQPLVNKRVVFFRINKELQADFLLENFSHKAVFNRHDSRIEMHLVSQCEQEVTIANSTVAFAQGETIHTENSYKYTPENFTVLAAEAGFKHEQMWSDEEGLFSVYYFSVM